MLESASAHRLARVTARASTNNETDKTKIVINAIKEQICSEFETDGFKYETRKVCPSRFVYYHLSLHSVCCDLVVKCDDVFSVESLRLRSKRVGEVQ